MFLLILPAHQGSPGLRAIKQLYVCVHGTQNPISADVCQEITYSLIHSAKRHSFHRGIGQDSYLATLLMKVQTEQITEYVYNTSWNSKTC